MTHTQLMGIVNLTPDSFSDGGQYASAEQALAAINQMAKDGATIIDIGAESTRPGATPLTHEQEWQRLAPVLSQLPALAGVEYSLDTRHAQTAEKALSLGVHWINDVSGFADPAMRSVVAASSCRLVVMHSLSVPADKQVTLPEQADVVQELLDFAQKRIAQLGAEGIGKERIIFDIGLGFGKTPVQCIKLLHDIERFKALGLALLVGHSRKSFLAGLSASRDEATLAVSQYLMTKKVDYLRVHDVAAHKTVFSVVGSLHD
jgi:dihydropteroate synthase